MSYDMKVDGIWLTHRISSIRVCAAPACQGQMKIIFIKQGDVAYTAEDKTYYPTRNSLIIVPSWKVHYLAAKKDIPFERYVVKIDEGRVSSNISKKAWDGVDVIDCDGNEEMCRLFQKFDDYNAPGQGGY